MVDFIGIKEEIESLVISAEAFGSATAQADRARLLLQIRDQLEKLRAADEKSRAELQEFYKRTSKGSAGGNAIVSLCPTATIRRLTIQSHGLTR